jgi:aryl-alcohol dehydrogenase-like predicted oxidoreductase
MSALVDSGRILCWGVSNWSCERIAAAVECAAKQGGQPPVASQPQWSFSHATGPNPSKAGTRYIDAAAHEWHTASQCPACVFNSTAGGYFGEDNVAWARTGFDGPPPKSPARDTPANRERLLRAIALADTKGCTANQVALAWLLNQPFPVYPIFSTSHPAHAVEALDAVNVTLTDEERDGLSS